MGKRFQKRRIYIPLVRLRLLITISIIIFIFAIFSFNIANATLLATIGVSFTLLQWLFPLPIVDTIEIFDGKQEEEEELPRRMVDSEPPKNSPPINPVVDTIEIFDDKQEEEELPRRVVDSEPPKNSPPINPKTPEAPRSGSVANNSTFMSDEDIVKRLAQIEMNLETGDVFEFIDRTSLEN